MPFGASALPQRCLSGTSGALSSTSALPQGISATPPRYLGSTSAVLSRASAVPQATSAAPPRYFSRASAVPRQYFQGYLTVLQRCLGSTSGYLGITSALPQQHLGATSAAPQQYLSVPQPLLNGTSATLRPRLTLPQQYFGGAQRGRGASCVGSGQASHWTRPGARVPPLRGLPGPRTRDSLLRGNASGATRAEARRARRRSPQSAHGPARRNSASRQVARVPGRRRSQAPPPGAGLPPTRVSLSPAPARRCACADAGESEGTLTGSPTRLGRPQADGAAPVSPDGCNGTDISWAAAGQLRAR